MIDWRRARPPVDVVFHFFMVTLRFFPPPAFPFSPPSPILPLPPPPFPVVVVGMYRWRKRVEATFILLIKWAGPSQSGARNVYSAWKGRQVDNTPQGRRRPEGSFFRIIVRRRVGWEFSIGKMCPLSVGSMGSALRMPIASAREHAMSVSVSGR